MHKRLLILLTFAAIQLFAATPALPVPQALTVVSRQLRVDLHWRDDDAAQFEVQRAQKADGPFEMLALHSATRPFASDFIGESGGNYYYRVRAAQPAPASKALEFSDWSAVAKGSPLPAEPESLLGEVQEAGIRYFYDYGHPVSGLARESFLRNPNLCATGATGMGLFNLVVGIERGFISRDDGLARTLKILDFLSEKADRFHGAFPHWLDGTTGKTVPFSALDDGADLVETAFLIEGVLTAREYFAQNSPDETRLRKRADDLWRAVEWDWFVRETNSSLCLQWHWSPKNGWKKNLRIAGFNEAQAAYLLALASPTHPIQPKCYRDGWINPLFGQTANATPARLDFPRENVGPMFFTHYSYLGFDPRKITCGTKSYFEVFQDLCHSQITYAESKRGEFDGYGPMWGLTASYGPDGYRAFAPGRLDNGTLAPTAALSSMPYVPNESRTCLMEMYQKYGKKLWGPFGFYDAFNLKRNWVSDDVLGIDVGPIAPMIENYRSGLCWKLFMNAKEISPLVATLAQPIDNSPLIAIPAVAPAPLTVPAMQRN
ncbi:MAG TPA: glucoamylase family protein [Planctomycetota bacterium]|nr:glucoamylase family protein [Planctomycetota bacterium]